MTLWVNTSVLCMLLYSWSLLPGVVVMCRCNQEAAGALVAIGKGGGQADRCLLQSAPPQLITAARALFRNREAEDVLLAVTQSDHTGLHLLSFFFSTQLLLSDSSTLSSFCPHPWLPILSSLLGSSPSHSCLVTAFHTIALYLAPANQVPNYYKTVMWSAPPVSVYLWTLTFGMCAYCCHGNQQCWSGGKCLTK